MSSEIFALTFEEDLYRIPAAVTVVIDKPWSHISAEEQNLLGKILGSVKQSLNSVTVVDLPTPEISAFPDGARVLCFGSVLAPSIPPYTVHRSGKSVFIQADSLPILEPDAAKKKELWNAMKQGLL